MKGLNFVNTSIKVMIRLPISTSFKKIFPLKNKECFCSSLTKCQIAYVRLVRVPKRFIFFIDTARESLPVYQFLSNNFKKVT